MSERIQSKLTDLRSFSEKLVRIQNEISDMYGLVENLGYSPNNVLTEELHDAQQSVEDAWVTVNIMIDDIEDEMEDDS